AQPSAAERQCAGGGGGRRDGGRPRLGAAPLLVAGRRLRQQDERREQRQALRHSIAKLLAQRGQVVPITEPLPQEEKLRQRGAVRGRKTHDACVRLHRALELVFAFEESGELELQRGGIGLS